MTSIGGRQFGRNPSCWVPAYDLPAAICCPRCAYSDLNSLRGRLDYPGSKLTRHCWRRRQERLSGWLVQRLDLVLAAFLKELLQESEQLVSLTLGGLDHAHEHS